MPGLINKSCIFCKNVHHVSFCVQEEHSAISMNLHDMENHTGMLIFIYHKELFFFQLGLALKVGISLMHSSMRYLVVS